MSQKYFWFGKKNHLEFIQECLWNIFNVKGMLIRVKGTIPLFHPQSALMVFFLYIHWPA